MPYELKKIAGHEGGDYCVVKKSGEVVKCHPTEEKAKAHLTALAMNVSDAKSSVETEAVRWDFGESFRREIAFDEHGVNVEARSCEMAISSEAPVTRGDYDEVLLHDAEHCDLSRLNDGAHPLLLNHDPDRQIGVIDSARLCPEDRKIRVITRFSQSSMGEEVWRDVRDGIRRLVSVGYRRTREVSSEQVNGREVVRFAWQPYEASIVAIPADPTTGIGRSAPITTSEENTISVMEENKDANRTAKDILKVAKNLRGKVDNIDDLAQSAIDQDWTLERFQQEALNKLPQAKPLEKPVLADVPARDWSNYSITRAINKRIEGGTLDGFEGEMSREVSRQINQTPSGFWLPPQALITRNFVAGTGTMGGMVVETSNLGAEFIELLRNRAKVIQLGARTIQLQNPVTIPQQNAAGAANWVAETTAATLSVGNFTQITLTPKGCSAFQQYSKQLLATSNPSIDALVRNDITQILALALDYACLHGPGTASPTGIAGTTGIATVALGTNAAAFTSANAYPAIVSLETEVATDNADVGALAYLTSAKGRGALKIVDQSAAANTAQWVWTPENTLNSYRAEVSNQVSNILTKGTATTICTAIFFGNWNDLLIGEFNGGATDLVVDPYTLAANAVIRLIARHWWDCGVRHAASFSVILDALC